MNAPTSWHWTFTGGFPGSSTLQNPTSIQYNVAGIYPVKSVATNSFGSDSLTQFTYINVANSSTICKSTAMTTNNGIIYDSGGPNGDYTDQENCFFLLDPCRTNLTLTFCQFDIKFQETEKLL